MKIAALDETTYAGIPMHISGNRIYRLTRPDAMTLHLCEEDRKPFAFDVPDEHPASWKSFITFRHFKMVGIYEDGKAVAAMSLVHDNPSIRMLDGRKDVLLIWDLRVAPEHQGKGYGKALVSYAREKAQELRLKHLRIETQNTNPNAVDFYKAMGFELAHIRQHAYCDESVEDAGNEHEIMLVFNEKLNN